MDYLLDTNIISETGKPVPNKQVMAWLRSVDPACRYVSAITIGELRWGVNKLRVRGLTERASVLERWVVEVEEDYRDRIVDVTVAVVRQWARFASLRTLAVADSLIAATALIHDLTVATRDHSGFADTGVRLVNPFETSFGAGRTLPV